MADEELPALEAVVAASRDDIEGTANAWELEKVTAFSLIGFSLTLSLSGSVAHQ